MTKKTYRYAVKAPKANRYTIRAGAHVSNFDAENMLAAFEKAKLVYPGASEYTCVKMEAI